MLMYHVAKFPCVIICMHILAIIRYIIMKFIVYLFEIKALSFYNAYHVRNTASIDS